MNSEWLFKINSSIRLLLKKNKIPFLNMVCKTSHRRSATLKTGCGVLFIAIILLVASPNTVFPQEGSPAKEPCGFLGYEVIFYHDCTGYKKRVGAVSTDNDAFAGFIKGNNDRFYTGGFFYEKVYLKDHPAENRPGFKWRHGVGYSIGLEVYTQSQIDKPIKDKGDRPTGGLLFLGPVYEILGQNGSIEIVNTFELDWACIGPCSHAESLQNTLHELLPGLARSVTPQNWDNQVGPLSGYILKYDFRLVSTGGIYKNRMADASLLLGASLGNLFQSGRVGVEIRFNPFSDKPIAPFFEGGFQADTPNKIKFGHFIAGVTRNFVRKNVLIEGAPSDPPESTEETKEIVDEQRLGFTVDDRDWSFEFILVGRELEFKNHLPTFNEKHFFGTFRIIWNLSTE